MMAYYAFPCPCGHHTCKNWLVSGVAAYQGVSFTEHQARAVAGLLNMMEQEIPGAGSLVTTIMEFQK